MTRKLFFLTCSLMLALPTTHGIAAEKRSPITLIPKTELSVKGAQPACQGGIDDQGWADVAAGIKQATDDERAHNVLDIILRHVKKRQNFGNCVPVCTSIPEDAKIGAVKLLWDEGSGRVDVPYDPAQMGKWGPGPGWHRVQQDYETRSMGNGDKIVCKVVENWSDARNLQAILIVEY